MSEPKPEPKVIDVHIRASADPARVAIGKRPGALVEDTSVAGTEAGKIVPKDPAGLVEGATDPRERKSEKPSGSPGA